MKGWANYNEIAFEWENLIQFKAMNIDSDYVAAGNWYWL